MEGIIKFLTNCKNGSFDGNHTKKQEHSINLAILGLRITSVKSEVNLGMLFFYLISNLIKRQEC